MPDIRNDKRETFRGLLGEGKNLCFVFDFDGTLAPIVDDPLEARVSEFLIEPLRALAARTQIKVVSGRPVDFLIERLRDVFLPTAVDLEIFGKYGIESGTLAKGVTRVFATPSEALSQLHALEDAMRPLMPEGCFIEEKGTSTGYHFRQNPSQQQNIHDLLLGNIRGLQLELLELHGGKMVFEAMVKGVPTKRSVVLGFQNDFEGIFFAGDDLGDVDALNSVSELPDGRGFTVLVRGSVEAEEKVGSFVDLIVEDQVQLADLII